MFIVVEFHKSLKIFLKYFVGKEKWLYLHSQKRKQLKSSLFHWELSSAAPIAIGAEHPPKGCKRLRVHWELSSAGSEHLPYKQRVTGSNPVVPTPMKTSLSGN